MVTKPAAFVMAASVLLSGCQTEAPSSAGGVGAAPAKKTVRACPSNPKIGRSGSVSGRIEVIERGGTMTFISVAGCPVRIFAAGQVAASCKRGGIATARGRIDEYDLFPTMETLFIEAKSVQCSGG